MTTKRAALLAIPDRRKVQWHPPPNQDAILVSYGKSPATSRPLESPASGGVFVNFCLGHAWWLFDAVAKRD